MMVMAAATGDDSERSECRFAAGVPSAFRCYLRYDGNEGGGRRYTTDSSHLVERG
jgi:hypothetical protein